VPANLISKQKSRDSYYLVERHQPWHGICGFSYLDTARGTEDLDCKFIPDVGKNSPLHPSWFADWSLLEATSVLQRSRSHPHKHTQTYV